jgi:hypothetical protein
MLKRIGIYLNEMFPITSFIGTMLTALAVQLTYLRLYGVSPRLELALFIPGMVLVLISLLLRIMDEFKDYQDDLRNFPDRPLPSGRVTHFDLKVLGWICVGGVVLLSTYSLPMFLWGIVTLAFTGLMLKWFFMETIMRKSLPLALVTHHPIVVYNFLYVIIASMEMYPGVDFGQSIYILPVVFIFTNWELTRKIRAPEQETAYTTYSKIMGPRPAILTALLLQLLFIGAVVLILMKIFTPAWLVSLFLLVQAGLLMPSLIFLLRLSQPRPLKQYAEAQILVVVGTLFVAALL